MTPIKTIFAWLGGAFMGSLALFLFMGNTQTEEKKNQDEFMQYYRVYSLATPKTIQFAGTQISLSDFDVAERYDKEILTNVYWQSQTILMIKRSYRFFPIIEPILKAQGIPADFKYIALAESGLQNVVSPAGAAGFWQFMDKTGKRYNLEINEEIDERYHLQKATYAACAYFKEAYTQLKDWNLVAASYNMGIEGVKRQVKAQNVQNYYDLYLNVETARYLFRIIAIKDICENPNQFGFHIAPTDFYQPVPVVYVKTDLSISSLATWSNDNGCNYKLLKLLNPWLRKPFINVAPGMIYYIALPKNRMMQTASARSIKNDTLVLSNTNQNIQPNEDVFTEFNHIVLKGESIKSIAEKYKVSEEDIILWNELLNSSVLAPGSIIKIKKTGSDF